MLFLSAFGFGSEASYKSVELVKRVEKLALTSDSKHIIAVFDHQTEAAVLNAETFEVISTLTFDSEGPLLSRSPRLFVADKKSGLVKVFSETTWKLIDEIDTGVKDLTTLSAKSGEKFDGKLLASSRQIVNLVDVENDAHRTLQQECSNAKFSADGKYVIDNGNSDSRAFLAED